MLLLTVVQMPDFSSDQTAQTIARILDSHKVLCPCTMLIGQDTEREVLRAADDALMTVSGTIDPTVCTRLLEVKVECVISFLGLYSA